MICNNNTNFKKYEKEQTNKQTNKQTKKNNNKQNNKKQTSKNKNKTKTPKKHKTGKIGSVSQWDSKVRFLYILVLEMKISRLA